MGPPPSPWDYSLLGSMCYCPYCKVHSIHNGYVYCPCTTPTDYGDKQLEKNGLAHEKANNKKTYKSRRKSTITSQKPPNRSKDYDPHNLPMRSNNEFRSKAAHVSNWHDPEYETHHGIKRLSIFSQLSSIDFPKSFPVDGMHAFFENVVGSLFDHMRGQFPVNKTLPRRPTGTKPTPSERARRNYLPKTKRRITNVQNRSLNIAQTDNHSSDADKSHDERSPQPQRNPKHLDDDLSDSSFRQNAKAAEKPKFCQSDEPYCVTPAVWDEIAPDVSRSKATFATCLGNSEPIRSITRWCHQYKAVEWKNWAVIFSPIYLKAHLPTDFYNMYIKLIRAIQISCSTFVLPDDIKLVNPPPSYPCWLTPN